MNTVAFGAPFDYLECDLVQLAALHHACALPRVRARSPMARRQKAYDAPGARPAERRVCQVVPSRVVFRGMDFGLHCLRKAGVQRSHMLGNACHPTRPVLTREQHGLDARDIDPESSCKPVHDDGNRLVRQDRLQTVLKFPIMQKPNPRLVQGNDQDLQRTRSNKQCIRERTSVH